MKGVCLTFVKHDEPGATMGARCEVCYTLTFFHNPHGVKPKYGDCFILNQCCLDQPLHNLPKIKFDWLVEWL